MTLHDELQRIGDRAPVADVPDDTWARARRSRRRDLAVTVGAVAAAIALLAGTVIWWPTHHQTPVLSTEDLGVPDHLYDVPAHMWDRETDGSWTHDEVTDDPTVVGIGAAAWVDTVEDQAVVVGAADGRYHLLDLPDFAGINWRYGNGYGGPIVALSPDGRDLAYPYDEPAPGGVERPSLTGIRVVDLTTGEVREIPVPGRIGTTITRIEWSQDGSLSFLGMEHRNRGATYYVVRGQVPPGTSQAEVSRANSDLEMPIDRPRMLGTTPDGTRVQIYSEFTEDESAVALVEPDGTERDIIEMPGWIGAFVSLATDLMTTDRPTVDRPAPDWPWSPDTRHRLALLVIAVLLALAGIAHHRLSQRPAR